MSVHFALVAAERNHPAADMTAAELAHAGGPAVEVPAHSVVAHNHLAVEAETAA